MKLGGLCLLLLLAVLLTLNAEFQAVVFSHTEGICVMECYVDQDCKEGEECLSDGCGRGCYPVLHTVVSIPPDCCLAYTTRRIPRKLVQDYYKTSSYCSKPGIIFQTKKGRQICANPEEAWVQEYIIDLKLSA
uniref:C-C motif chemokine n=1 Tax=Sus scrofa TaxID=9823 RepID=A0A8D0UKR3_PIG